MKSLRRAELVVITRSELVSEDAMSLLRGEIQRLTGAPVVVTRFTLSGLIASGGERASLDELQSTAVAAFCGIGNPAAFEQSLTMACGSELKGFRSYPDHHHYTSSDVEALSRWSAELGAGCLVTTRKDLVKLNRNVIGKSRLWALDVDVAFDVGENLLLQAIHRTLAGSRSAG